MVGIYYTLIWKCSDVVLHKSFIFFEDLRDYVTEHMQQDIKNLKVVDDEKTIYYLEIEN